MPDPSLSHCCVSCGEPFHPASAEVALCPACGGPPEASPEGFVDLTQPADFSLPNGDVLGVRSAWQIGDVILDTYEVKHIFTSGGMGVVYRVHHRSWNIDLALKSPRAEIFSRPGGKENFVREAETWVDLGLHPHIVSCYYVRTIDEIPRVFAEFVEGGSLKDWIEDKRLYAGGRDKALERILDIAIQFAWGLAYAHEQGLVHQDVKPANVLMTPEGIAKVSDFGLSKARILAGETAPPRNGNSILASSGGYTPAYCSPEQARGQKLSIKTDIWSWAVSILEIFTGEVTWYSGVAALEALEGYQQSRTLDPQIPDMPGKLADLLRRCLQESLAQRSSGMLEVAGQIQDIYLQEIGQPYPRQNPKAAELRADSLNNRAVSFLDIGSLEKALETFTEALHIEPTHLEANYNRSILDWRAALVTDEALLQRLQLLGSVHQNSAAYHYLLGLVQLERGYLEQAIDHLKTAAEEINVDLPLKSAINYKDRETRRLKRIRFFSLLAGDEGFWTEFSPSGRCLLQGENGGSIHVYETGQGRQLLKMPGTKIAFGIRTVGGFSKDESKVMTICNGKDMRVWEVNRRSCVHTVQISAGEVICGTLIDSGRSAAVGDRHGKITLLDASREIIQASERVSSSPISAIAPSTDDCTLLAGCEDGKIYILELPSLHVKTTLTGHQAGILRLCHFKRGRILVSADSQGFLKVWDLEHLTCLNGFQTERTELLDINLFDDRLAVTMGTHRNVHIWDLWSGRCLLTVDIQEPWSHSVCISEERRTLLIGAGSDRGGFAEWYIDVLSQAPLYLDQWAQPTLCRPRTTLVESLAEEQFNALMAKAGDEISKGRWQAAQQSLQSALAVEGYAKAVPALDKIHELGKHGIRSRIRELWIVDKLRGHQSAATAVSFSNDWRIAASGSADNTLRLWDIGKRTCLATLEGHQDEVTSLAFNPKCHQVASGSADRQIRIWDSASRRCLAVLKGHTGIVTSVIYDPGGEHLLSGSEDGTVREWDLSRSVCKHIYHLNRVVNSISVAPDGQTVAIGYGHGGVALLNLSQQGPEWDYQNQERVTARSINSVAFQPAGNAIFAGSVDGSGILISKETGERLKSWKFVSGSWKEGFPSIGCISPSPCGRFVILACGPHLAISEVSGKHPTVWRKSLVAVPQSIKMRPDSPSNSEYTFRSQYGVNAVMLSPDGRTLISAMVDGAVWLWEVEWEYLFPEPTNWDENARPYLETFLTLHTPYGPDGCGRLGKPSWSEDAFQNLLTELGCRGFGWLRPEGVRKRLEELAAGRS
jgi:WD40 repeat protein/serine/threonine protein kinase